MEEAARASIDSAVRLGVPVEPEVRTTAAMSSQALAVPPGSTVFTR